MCENNFHEIGKKLQTLQETYSEEILKNHIEKYILKYKKENIERDDMYRLFLVLLGDSNPSIDLMNFFYFLISAGIIDSKECRRILNLLNGTSLTELQIIRILQCIFHITSLSISPEDLFYISEYVVKNIKKDNTKVMTIVEPIITQIACKMISSTYSDTSEKAITISNRDATRNITSSKNNAGGESVSSKTYFLRFLRCISDEIDKKNNTFFGYIFKISTKDQNVITDSEAADFFAENLGKITIRLLKSSKPLEKHYAYSIILNIFPYSEKYTDILPKLISKLNYYHDNSKYWYRFVKNAIDLQKSYENEILTPCVEDGIKQAVESINFKKKEDILKLDMIEYSLQNHRKNLEKYISNAKTLIYKLETVSNNIKLDTKLLTEILIRNALENKDKKLFERILSFKFDVQILDYILEIKTLVGDSWDIVKSMIRRNTEIPPNYIIKELYTFPKESLVEFLKYLYDDEIRPVFENLKNSIVELENFVILELLFYRTKDPLLYTDMLVEYFRYLEKTKYRVRYENIHHSRENTTSSILSEKKKTSQIGNKSKTDVITKQKKDMTYSFHYNEVYEKLFKNFKLFLITSPQSYAAGMGRILDLLETIPEITDVIWDVLFGLITFDCFDLKKNSNLIVFIVEKYMFSLSTAQREIIVKTVLDMAMLNDNNIELIGLYLYGTIGKMFTVEKIKGEVEDENLLWSLYTNAGNEIIKDRKLHKEKSVLSHVLFVLGSLYTYMDEEKYRETEEKIIFYLLGPGANVSGEIIEIFNSFLEKHPYVIRVLEVYARYLERGVLDPDIRKNQKALSGLDLVSKMMECCIQSRINKTEVTKCIEDPVNQKTETSGEEQKKYVISEKGQIFTEKLEKEISIIFKNILENMSKKDKIIQTKIFETLCHLPLQKEENITLLVRTLFQILIAKNTSSAYFTEEVLSSAKILCQKIEDPEYVFLDLLIFHFPSLSDRNLTLNYISTCLGEKKYTEDTIQRLLCLFLEVADIVPIEDVVSCIRRIYSMNYSDEFLTSLTIFVKNYLNLGIDKFTITIESELLYIELMDITTKLVFSDKKTLVDPSNFYEYLFTAISSPQRNIKICGYVILFQNIAWTRKELVSHLSSLFRKYIKSIESYRSKKDLDLEYEIIYCLDGILKLKDIDIIQKLKYEILDLVISQEFRIISKAKECITFLFRKRESRSETCVE